MGKSPVFQLGACRFYKILRYPTHDRSILSVMSLREAARVKRWHDEAISSHD